MTLYDKAREILKKFYGYDNFRKGQEQVVRSLLAGQDTVAIMPTGAGKSICFQIPALMLEGVTLVISPLISLMKDQVDSLQQQGIPATYINSSLSREEYLDNLQGIEAGYYKIIYMAPERLARDYLPGVFRRLQISFIAVDEAHCLSQWGHDFRPSYLNILDFYQSLPKKPLIGAFTATATPEVKADIIKLLALAKPATFVTGFDRPNLSFHVYRGEKKDRFVLDYVKAHEEESGIIYAGTRKDVDALVALLNFKGFKAGRYHAGMDDEDRRRAQEDYLYDRIQVMVATNAFGMGIDKSNVRYVVHYNMPKNIEAYYQEAGRAGRDGLPGECVLLYNAGDQKLQRFLIENSEKEDFRKEIDYRHLQSMVEYCHTPQCLRSFILHYFGEVETEEHCGNCSSCKTAGEQENVTIEAQMVLSCVYRMRERYGSKAVAEVLKGSSTAKILRFGLDKLSTYGLLKQWTLEKIHQFILKLTAMQYLQVEEGQYPVLKLNRLSYEVMAGRKKVWMKQVKIKNVAPGDPLFVKLKEIRKRWARVRGVPPYMIFSDATLQEIAQQKPGSLSELGRIKGIGDLKLRHYGQDLLAIIKDFNNK